MKISLLNVLSERRECVNKDVMGGFGEATSIGDSIGARLIERLKKNGVKLPIFSLAYLAAIFSQNNHEVEFITNEIPEADLVVIPSSIVEYKAEIEMAEKIRQQTNAKVGFIGPFATFKPDIFLKHADFVIQGEPEYIAARIKTTIPTGLIKSKPIQNLDALPYPKWDIFPINEYSYYPVIKSKPFLPILSSRGCSYTCNYCPYKAYYGGWRKRSINYITKEIEYLIRQYNVKGLLFRDPLFTLDKKRSMSIAENIIKNRWDIEWACETHFDLLDKVLIDKLYASGLRSLNVGIESFDEEILKKATRKAAKKEHQESIIKYCDKIGVKVSTFYIFGLPDDTSESIQRTIQYAKKLNTHVAQFFISTPFPGTEFYEQVKDKIYADWDSFNSFTPTFKHKNLSEKELLELKELAYLQYYFRLSYLFKYFKRMAL